MEWITRTGTVLEYGLGWDGLEIRIVCSSDIYDWQDSSPALDGNDIYGMAHNI